MIQVKCDCCGKIEPCKMNVGNKLGFELYNKPVYHMKPDHWYERVLTDGTTLQACSKECAEKLNKKLKL